MSVDLIKAFDRIAASGEGSGAEAAPRESEFPAVLESSIQRSSDEDSGSPSSSQEHQNADAGEKQQTASQDDGPQGESPGGQNGEDSKEAAEAAAESGAPAGQTAAMTDRARADAKVEADAAAAGRLTDLDQALDGGASDPGEDNIEELDAERAAEVVARLEAEGQLPGSDEATAPATTTATTDASATGAAAGALPQARVSSSEEGREIVSDVRVAGDGDAGRVAEDAVAANESLNQEEQGDQGARDDAQRPSDEALFDRAAEGSQQGGVDPNLRQAIANQEEAQRAPEVAAVDGAAAVASPVANAITETTTTATPGSPQPAAASDAIAVQTEWLATRGGGTARMVLHPPELGEIAIRVTLRGTSVDVVMVAQEAIAQGVAEEQSERLAQAFSNRDLRLENFDVRRGGAEDLPNADTGQFAEQQAERDAREEAASGQGNGRGGGSAGDGDEIVDLPRILTAAPEAGVDLRI